jgi:hypothetical protein
MTLEGVTEGVLLYFVLPLWVLTGAADALCHRICRIEETSGVLETIIHLLMAAEIGVALLAALFLELTGLVLVSLLVLWTLHEATSYWDLHYASSRRFVPPWEQRVHDYLAVLPLLALVLVGILHWAQVQAIVGLGPQPFDGSIRPKHDPLSPAYLVSLLSAIFLFNLLPYLFELARGLRRGKPERTGSEQVASS